MTEVTFTIGPLENIQFNLIEKNEILKIKNHTLRTEARDLSYQFYFAYIDI